MSSNQNIPFNNTFTKDKPIIYPSTWESGKNAQQLFQQFKLTLSYWILKNAIQCILATIWIFIIYVVISAIYQIWKLCQLPQDSRQYLINKNYTKSQFKYSVAFIAFVIFSITVGLIIIKPEFINSFMKGIGTWIVILVFYYIWSRFIKKESLRKDKI